MRRAIAIALLLTGSAAAQTRRPPARKPPPPPAAKTITPDITCPTPLGVGLKTRLAF